VEGRHFKEIVDVMDGVLREYMSDVAGQTSVVLARVLAGNWQG
jgi:hypothetical protein